MFCRCIIIAILTTNQVFAQSHDEVTAQWLIKKAKNITKQNAQDDLNLDQSFRAISNGTEEQNQIKDDTNKENEESLNLDPNLDALNLGAPPAITPIKRVSEEKEVSNDNSNVNSSSSDIPQECYTKDNQLGACVLYFQCDSDQHTIIEDGMSLIDLRSQERSCPHYLEVCCLKNKVTATNKKPSVENALDIHGTDKIDPNSSKCGWSNPALHIFQTTSKEIDDNRIYANYGDFPWMIALIKKRNATDDWSRNDYLGGGSLIHPAVVVTAAHKIDQYAPREIKCRAGEWDTQTTFELFGHQERDVSKIIIHPEFFKTSVYNDIAVLFLKSEFEMKNSPNIGLACVGTSLPPPGTECFSMGWGKEFKEKKKYAVILKKVRLPLVGLENCEELLRKTRLGPYFKLHKSLTCAGGESGVDTCRGDGGSSLVCPIQTLGASTKYAVFGMVAYGIGCGKENVPSVYVNVPHLKPWLDATVSAEGYTSNIKCRAGEWDTQTTFELFGHQERDVSKIIIHPEFFKTSVYNDIAVLFLKSEFEMKNSPNIGLACVGTSLPPPGTECFSMGWGKEFKEKKKYAVILKKVRLPLVGLENCEELLRKTRLGPYFKLHKSLTCAGGESGVDTCRGDGGSSLVCPIQTLGASTKYAVFGMVAYGIGCGKENVPSVYVNVPHLKPWLDATVSAEGYTSNIKCRAGEWDTQTTFELFGHQERDVSKIIIHPEFFKTSVYNDIAVLFLKSEFEMKNSPNIGLACVGTSLPPPGTECFSMGWGKEFKEKKKYAVILKKVRLPLVGLENCEELLRKTRLGPYFKLHKSLTCAGGESGVDTCRGDGGSSLVCPIQTLGASTKYAVFGMVAYGIGCGKENVPSVYVNVPHLKPWLDATVSAEGYTSNVYRK